MSETDTILKERVHQYIELDDQIKCAGKALTELRKKRNELKGYITEVMNENDLDFISFPGGKLILQPSVRKVSLDRNYTMNVFKRYGLPDDIVDNAVVDLFDNREKTTTMSLGRRNHRVARE
jgi:DNA mismatch repair ATPase MutS